MLLGASLEAAGCVWTCRVGMGWDERLFGWLASRWSGRRSAEVRQRAERAVQVEPRLGRLRTIATAVAGEELEAAIVDGAGGVGGRLVLLPREVWSGPSRQDNEQLLVAMAAFAGAMARTGLGRGEHEDEDRSALRLLLAVPAVERALVDELPRWADGRAAAVPWLLEGRPAPSTLRGRACALEALARERLGVAVDDAGLPADVVEVLARVRAGAAVGSIDAAFCRLRPASGFVPVPLWGRLLRASESVAAPPASGLPTRVTSEREGRKRAPARRRTLEQHRDEENPLTHSFEKVHTAEEHRGGSKRADGSDELHEHGAALDELDLDEVVLSSEATRSVYRAGAPSGGADDETLHDGDGLRYDEWDGARRRYLPGYCRLRVMRPPSDAEAGQRLAARVGREQRRGIGRARAEVLRLETALRWRTRQLDGPDVDLDAAIDRATTVRAGHEGTRRVYVSRRRAARELAVLVLLDASSSTDAWVEGRRVLDVERDAAAIVGLATEGLLDELGLAAFFSDTHEDCRYVELKRFDEPWPVGLGRLATLAPAGYTRIGPAVRHGVAALTRCRARRRVLLLLTDGKPGDRDRYEGRHGEADVRQALREAGRAGVEVLALGADPRAAAHLGAMFGSRGVAGLSRPEDVAKAIAETCARRMRR